MGVPCKLDPNLIRTIFCEQQRQLLEEQRGPQWSVIWWSVFCLNLLFAKLWTSDSDLLFKPDRRKNEFSLSCMVKVTVLQFLVCLSSTILFISSQNNDFFQKYTFLLIVFFVQNLSCSSSSFSIILFFLSINLFFVRN